MLGAQHCLGFFPPEEFYVFYRAQHKVPQKSLSLQLTPQDFLKTLLQLHLNLNYYYGCFKQDMKN